MVGTSGSGGQNAQAFLYTQAEGATGLGKADVGSAANAINNSGQLVGDLAKGSGPTGRTFASFNENAPVDPNRLIDPTSASTLTRATDINAVGQIGAFGLTSLDVMHALRLAPQVPDSANSLVAAASGADGTSTPMPVSMPSLHVELGAPQPVPEPSVLALFGIVSAGLVARRRIARRRAI
ncbi:PEP-CTERM sorting domain-containing protein [Singulisphaera sp. GP187]|uniref:PEP-CTERM sorting domain-containing protein n=1 Tax=Singulisphaera sp. GP187 TaxID=1882752 RepID=UPI0020B13290|nr:PEP-CTERM sorting domain-containing protein [Singulisphaera sp. GP187]